MKNITFYLPSLFLFVLVLTGCSNDEQITTDNTIDDDGEQFIIAAKSLAPGAEGVADYLLTADDLSTGSISLTGNGVEQDGTSRYYITNNNRFFSFLYGKENSGAVTAYELGENGELIKLTDFQSVAVAAFAAIDDDIFMMDMPRNGSPIATWYQLSTESLTFTDQGQIDVFELAGNGEQAFFTWFTDVGDYLFAPYMGFKMCCNDKWGTEYPDNAWVAVFNYPEMTLEKVIKDDRTSFIGKYFTKGLEKVENGDVYAFSSATADNNAVMSSTKPSAITRIKKGTLEFDQSYFFNIKEASNGHYVSSHIYAGDGLFVLKMMPISKKQAYAEGKKLAVVNVFDKTFTWIQGIPAVDQIVSTAMNNYASKDENMVYMGITTKQGSFVYNIEVASATATQGIEVEGGAITAIEKLEVAK